MYAPRAVPCTRRVAAGYWIGGTASFTDDNKRHIERFVPQLGERFFDSISCNMALFSDKSTIAPKPHALFLELLQPA
jgi:hypothetical protein